MRNGKEMKQNEAKKRNETKRKIVRKKNILKQNEGKKASIYFCFEAKQKHGNETKQNKKY
jgi:hypothetical protein